MESDIKPVLSLNATVLKRMEPIISKLPSDPFEIAAVAQSNGENVQRLSCCIKLIRMYYNAIPQLVISGKTSKYIDKFNHKFEEELTISKRIDPKSITALFTCCMISVGTGAIKKYLQAPSSPNPFAQCMRIICRITWFLRSRYRLLDDLHSQNKIGILNNSLRIANFRDLCASGQRAAIFAATSIPSNVDLRLFAYHVPRRYITDSVKSLYEEFKKMLSDERRNELEDLEVQVDLLLKAKLSPTFFSAKSNVDDTILALFPFEDIYDDVFENMLSGYLHEIAPDHEFDIFKEDFEKAATKAASVRLGKVKRHFDLVHIVNHDVPPLGWEPPSNISEESRTKKTTKPGDFTMFDMFKTDQNFIENSRKLYQKKY
ncbi:hypothetical protein TVAG_433680 [Trichomonas vaginalis G3]|uniref:Uncharacterized protein n=1 Tax=Trichomonas vaginalis (strain ATCC PRA-98 / G3) TaxID=412133 RepID=A2F7R3_TRIV3|nr:hypothetical protein TVAGG3_0248250 [Trichomonas vaginalis G3]EAX99040.1 hypothetical protein TVAG_433680 [Trichomonas vaginalis G3]KAI5553805.1 hypothetical protein TVAGG3_0248250 [Trichomonas vaginalis G3]|eukprot:XP_001311970.1 hypothetical protein [Trichomonas vaginalis G3]